MAQVEFTAVMLTLLRNHRVDAVALEGESRADVDRRLDGIMKESFPILTLQMKGVYDVTGDKGLKLRLSKRR
jgi:hypothetical protein